MIALVTGGCSGLGEVFTRVLASRGYKVYALYNRSVDNALALEDEFENVRCIKCDIRNESEIENVLFNINDIDIFINNAGVSHDNSYEDKSKKEFMEVLETNVVGTFLMIKHGIETLSDKGIIINISSNAAIDANTIYSMDYDASKAGVNMLTKDFALVFEQSNKNIRIVSICPGWINTDEVLKADPTFIEEELIRTNQDRLIDKEELVKYILDNLSTYKNGEIVELKNLGEIYDNEGNKRVSKKA